MKIIAFVEEPAGTVGRQGVVKEVEVSGVLEDVVKNPKKYYGPQARGWHFYREGSCFSQTDLPLGTVVPSGHSSSQPY